MLSRIALAFCSLVVVFSAVPAEAAGKFETFFDRLEQSYVAGQFTLMDPLKYRDGKVLVFPARVAETAYEKNENIRTVMIVQELKGSQQTSPILGGDVFFAMIRTLPKYSYWRDNLPLTPHHGIIGGTRHVFRGDEMGVATRIARDYTSSFGKAVPDKHYAKSAAVVAALQSGVEVLRTDAAHNILHERRTTRFMTDETKKKLASFVAAGDHEDAIAEVTEAAGRWKLDFLEEALEKLASRDDQMGADALGALDELGKPRGKDKLEELTGASSEAVRAYAYGELAERAGDEEAWAASASVLTGEASAAVRAAVAAGLGRSKVDGAIGPLAKAIDRGDAVSRDAAGALAMIGSPKAISVLEDAVVNGKGEAKIGSVVALSQIHDCLRCVEFLSEQYESHPEEAVKDLIGAVTGRAKPHEH